MTTSITWPAGFPTPLLAGYGYQLGDPTQRTQFAVGARVRQVYSDIPDGFQALTFSLTKTQLAFFQGWRLYTVKGQWFTCKVKAAGTFEDRVIRLVGSPQLQLLDNNQGYQVVFACETREGTTMDQGTYDLISVTFDGDMDAFSNFNQWLETFVNVTMAAAGESA